MSTARLLFLAALPATLLFAPTTYAAGTLKPKNSSQAAIAIRDHAVVVVIRDGFARTEVEQTFVNPNAVALEALYSFPLPKSAALAEVTVSSGDEVTMRGEVVARDDARRIYEEERDAGNDAAVAEQNETRTFDFSIANVQPQIETTINFVYYQSLTIDTGVGRYLYPLESGGTDEARNPFWETNDLVEGALTLRLDLHSTYPVEKVHAPGFENATIAPIDTGVHRFEWKGDGARLNRDFVLYYALEDALPGRVEVVPYRADKDGTGTFMLVVTPGVDLKPLERGCDYTFLLDVSGSMASKLSVLADGVARSLEQLRVVDRFKIITFANEARTISGGYLPATRESVTAGIESVRRLVSNGSTNLEAGIQLALRGLDTDRTQAIVLVTDGVANVGGVDPQSFLKLLDKVDVRIFGFLLGNESNWPLVEVITGASGGFYECVSNQDDIVSRLALVKPKLTHEAMHAVELDLDGAAEVFDVDDSWFGNLYAGQQLVAFGRYRKAGSLDVELRCKISGEVKTYTSRVALPEVDATAPELERMFALHRVAALERATRRGLAESSETKAAVRDLGLQFQIVTDETSMLVLKDEAFARRGIARNNQTRADAERAAQIARAATPAVDRRADAERPMFDAPAFSRRSGSFDGMLVALSGCLLLFILLDTRRRHVG